MIHSVYDSQGRRIAEYTKTPGALLREYVWLGWEPIAVIEGGVVHFVRADHIGRPVFATNATGSVVWTAKYDPFGNVHASTGTPATIRFPPLAHPADALPGDGANGSKANPASTRTGCATMTQRQAAISKPTPSA